MAAIEKTIYDYMNGDDSGLLVPCYSEIPENPVPSYTTFERTGTAEENGIQTITFAFMSYADTLLEAVNLNDDVIEAVKKMVMLDEIFGVRIQSAYNSTDTRTKKRRYTAVAVIYC